MSSKGHWRHLPSPVEIQFVENTGPPIQRTGVKLGVWQAGSGVCTTLLCEGKMHWKETASTFQAQLPLTELSASGVVADAL